MSEINDSDVKAKSEVKKYVVKAGATTGGAAAGAAAGAVVNAATVGTYTTFAGHAFVTGTQVAGPVAVFLAANPFVAPAVGAAVGAFGAYKLIKRLLKD